MNNSRLSAVNKVLVPKKIVRDTLAILQMYGRKGSEGLVLWIGFVGEREASVQELYVPVQESISSESGLGYFVTGETLFLLNRTLADRKMRLIAQVHSHPEEAYHSEADDRYAIVTAEGGFSLVVPDFGIAPESPHCWAVYRLGEDFWAELSSEEIKQLFEVV